MIAMSQIRGMSSVDESITLLPSDMGNSRIRILKEPIKFSDASTKDYVDNGNRRLEQLVDSTNTIIKFLEGIVFDKRYIKKITLNAAATDLRTILSNVVRIVGVEVSEAGNLKLGFDDLGRFENSKQNITINITRPEGQYINLTSSHGT